MNFLHGCNYPWSTDGTTIFYGLDFGANIWGSHLGVSTRRASIARDFLAMAAAGFTIVRWFVFCDGRAGIVYDDRGVPRGPDAHLFQDLDAGLEIARSVGIRLDLVLFDHRWSFTGVRETIADWASGQLLEASLPEGRAHVFRSAIGRDGLFEHLLVPLVERYSTRGERSDLAETVFAYEFMNEPDFVVEEWERDVSPHVPAPLPFAALAELLSRLSDVVHACTTALATVGGARMHNLWAWDDDALGLDVLQLHSYPDRRATDEADVFGVAASELGVTRPVILGEFPADGPAHHPPGSSPPSWTLDEYLEFAVRGGYAGAWPWSFSGTDAYGTIPEEPLRRFAQRYPTLVNERARMAAR